MKKANRNGILAAIYSLLLIFLSGCEKETVQKIEQRNWQLVWSDELSSEQKEQLDLVREQEKVVKKRKK